jgi:BMFP domain-containing protein YqiC
MKTELAVREARIAELEKKLKEAAEPKANPMQNMIGEALKKKISELEEKLTEA